MGLPRLNRQGKTGAVRARFFVTFTPLSYSPKSVLHSSSNSKQTATQISVIPAHAGIYNFSVGALDFRPTPTRGQDLRGNERVGYWRGTEFRQTLRALAEI